MTYKYPVYQPDLSGNEKKYVNECLDSTWISSKGKFISEFENKFAEFIGVKYAAAVPNGTIALHLALLTLGIGPGDEVIVPTFTYIASVNAVTYCGAKPVFADSEKSFWQIDPSDVERKITSRTKVIMPVHLYGHPCEMDSLNAIAKKHNLLIVEDCAEAFGSRYKNIHVGNFGDVSTFSFFGNKAITTGEGGMVVTNDKNLYEKSIHIKGQGLAANREYWHDVVGYNYRMTNICAAIGLAQLERADSIIKKKKQLAEWYNKHLINLPVQPQREAGNVFNSYWMYTILVEKAEERDKLREHLKQNGIETRPAFFPVHTMPIYFDKNIHLPVAEDLCSRGINLPSYPALTEEDVKYIVHKIKIFYND